MRCRPELPQKTHKLGKGKDRDDGEAALDKKAKRRRIEENKEKAIEIKDARRKAEEGKKNQPEEFDIFSDEENETVEADTAPQGRFVNIDTEEESCCEKCKTTLRSVHRTSCALSA